MLRWKLYFLYCYMFWQKRWGRLYRISWKERPNRDRLAYTYGETPLEVIQDISSMVSIKKESRFLELGSGIGVFSLYLSLIYDCQAMGVEMIPSFVRSSQRCSQFLSLNCSFVEGDLWEINWSNWDCIYLTTTTFPVHWLRRLEEKVDEISKDAFLIVLTHQIQNQHLRLYHSFLHEFSWGIATIFVYQRQ